MRREKKPLCRNCTCVVASVIPMIARLMQMVSRVCRLFWLSCIGRRIKDAFQRPASWARAKHRTHAYSQIRHRTHHNTLLPSYSLVNNTVTNFYTQQYIQFQPNSRWVYNSLYTLVGALVNLKYSNATNTSHPFHFQRIWKKNKTYFFFCSVLDLLFGC